MAEAFDPSLARYCIEGCGILIAYGNSGAKSTERCAGCATAVHAGILQKRLAARQQLLAAEGRAHAS